MDCHVVDDARIRMQHRLREDVRPMRADGLDAPVEIASDFGHGFAAAEEAEDLEFTIREAFVRKRICGAAPNILRERFGE